MKAYYLSIKDDDEGVVAVVFANTAKEAKSHGWMRQHQVERCTSLQAELSKLTTEGRIKEEE